MRCRICKTSRKRKNTDSFRVYVSKKNIQLICNKCGWMCDIARRYREHN